MSEPRQQRIDEISGQAKRLAPADRAAFLKSVCGDDAELARQVQARLDGDRRDLQQTASGHLADSPTQLRRPTGPAPDHIGRYRIIRRIGAGGMGVVYEAEQEQPRRTVALKVIHPGLASATALRRFEFEAEVLAQLHHPGIAQIYEAGTFDTDAGRQPYFAMELIDGRPIAEYATVNNLDARQRLLLLARVADAVQHAHQRGVIHRDLKPANILVTNEDRTSQSGRRWMNAVGQPKILDFGVARTTEGDFNAVTMRTSLGELVGTLAYMSPEQAGGSPEELDTRSDVYALGVLAYELLSGQSPYDLRDKLVHEAVRIIQGEEPPPLSAVQRVLAGDVETIVRKAMEKDRTRRYQSASAVSADIYRYLNDEPIAARPPSALYQLRKFARRHRSLMVGTAAVAAALVLGTVVSILFAVGQARARADAEDAGRVAEARRVEAERQASIAAAVNQFLNEDLLAAADPAAEGREVTVLEVLDLASEGLRDRFPDEPLVRASLHSTIGRTYMKLGDLENAEPHLTEALRLRREQLGGDHQDTLQSMDELARYLRLVGEEDQAESLYSQVLEKRRQLLGPSDRLTVAAMQNLGSLYRVRGRYAEARPIIEEALALGRANLEEDDVLLLNITENLAGFYKDVAQYDQAIPLYEQTVAGRRRLSSDKPTLLRSMNNLAVVYRRVGRLQDALALYEEALALQTELLTVEHPATLVTMTNLAKLYEQLGDLEAAERMYEQAVPLSRKIMGDSFYGTHVTMLGLAGLRIAEQRFEEAESLLREVLSLREGPELAGHPLTLTIRDSLAYALMGQGRLEEALLILGRVIADSRERPGYWMTGVYLDTKAVCLITLERYEEAEAALLEAEEILSVSPGEDSAEFKGLAGSFIALYEQWDRPAQAELWRSRVPNAPPPTPLSRGAH